MDANCSANYSPVRGGEWKELSGSGADTNFKSLFVLGERGQDELNNRKPHLDLAATRYPRDLDEFETVFKKERNETFEMYQLLSRKQREAETLEEFHSVLSGLAARCSFGALERRVLRDVSIVNMSNKEAQTELCRSTKTPDEVYRIALSYERGDKYAKSYKVSGGGALAAPRGHYK